MAGGSGLGVGLVAGVVSGVASALLLAGLIAFLVVRARRRGAQAEEAAIQPNDELHHQPHVPNSNPIGEYAAIDLHSPPVVNVYENGNVERLTAAT